MDSVIQKLDSVSDGVGQKIRDINEGVEKGIDEIRDGSIADSIREHQLMK